MISTLIAGMYCSQQTRGAPQSQHIAGTPQPEMRPFRITIEQPFRDTRPGIPRARIRNVYGARWCPYHPPPERQMSRGNSMYRTIIALIALAISLPALAADLGKPAPAPEAAPAVTLDQWVGPYVEFGGAGQWTKGGDKNASGKVGIGYNTRQFGSPFVYSLFARYGFSAEGNHDAAVLTFDQPLTLAGRIGYLVRPSTLIYGLAGYSKSLDSDFRGPMLGLGAETPVFGNLRLAVEYTAQFDRTFKADADVIHEIGLYARLPF